MAYSLPLQYVSPSTDMSSSMPSSSFRTTSSELYTFCAEEDGSLPPALPLPLFPSLFPLPHAVKDSASTAAVTMLIILV